MRAADTAVQLEGFRGRGAGTDAERRAAGWLADQLGQTGREVVVEPFWCRPNWALAQACHVALALAGSLVSVSSPRVGGALLLAALIFILADANTGYSPGRRLTPEHASQNVVALPPARGPDTPGNLRLIITANYDVGRTGLAYRDPLRRAAARLRRATRGLTVGWLGWLTVDVVWLLVLAILRLNGHTSSGIGAAQLPPTIGLVLALALLLEQATASWSPGASANGTGVGVAVELVRALGAAALRHIDVELALTGAGDGEGIGLRRYLRTRRAQLPAPNTAVLAIAASGGGRPCWWRSQGALQPSRSAPRLRQLTTQVAAAESDLGAVEHFDRTPAPALPALAAGIPAIAIGAIDDHGVAPRSHQRTDTADAIDPRALDQVVQLGLALVDAMDADLAQRRHSGAATPA
jgi:hypothetical protein